MTSDIAKGEHGREAVFPFVADNRVHQHLTNSQETNLRDTSQRL